MDNRTLVRIRRISRIRKVKQNPHLCTEICRIEKCLAYPREILFSRIYCLGGGGRTRIWGNRIIMVKTRDVINGFI